MKTLIIIVISIFGIVIFNGCGPKTDKHNMADSIQTAEGVRWEPISPDTVWLRKKYTVVEIVTNLGRIEVALFDATPKHKANFIKLVESGFYDGLLFHRIKKDFMIQAGDPESKNASKDKVLNKGKPKYTLAAEIIDSLYHYRGALCAAREQDEENPEKASSGSQFYLVTGSLFNATALKNAVKDRAVLSFLANPDNLSFKMRLEAYQKRGDDAAMRILMQDMNREVQPLMDSLYSSISPKARQMYATWGGFPLLDKAYTIFGFMVSGFDVLEKAQNVSIGKNDRPLEDVKIIKCQLVSRP